MFVIYSFLGWCVEVVYTKYEYKKLVNRGFLNGPYCPIYGFGVLAIIFALSQFSNNVVALFVGSVILTTTLEFITGYVLEKIFHQKWWDYTVDAFNFKGYVCLWVSMVWGVGCVVVIYFVQPLVDGFINTFPTDIGKTLITVILTLMAIDLALTIVALTKLKIKVMHLDEILVRISAINEGINKNIAGGVIAARKSSEKRMQELDHLVKKYQDMVNDKVFGYRRITKAFPKFQPIKKNFKDKLK